MTQGIDFLTTTKQQKIIQKRRWQRFLTFSVLIGAVYLFVTLLLFGGSLYWRNLNQNLLQQVDAQKKAVETFKSREVQLFLFKNRLSAAAALFQPEKNYFLFDFRYLTGLLMPGVKLSELSWDKESRFLVSLEADQVVSLARFLDSFKTTQLDKTFTSLVVSSINRLEDGRYALNLIFARNEAPKP